MVRFTTFGGIDLRSSDDESFRTLLAQPRKVALLAYLAASSRGTPREREEVRAMLWPEHDESRARHSLNQVLHVLRSELGSEAIISIGRMQLALDADTVASDVEELYRAHRAGDSRTVHRCYAGEFLPAFFLRGLPDFDRWLDRKRAHLRQVAADAAWKLALVHETSGDAAAAVSYARRALDLSPYDEGTIQRVLRLLDRVGDRASAKRVFDTFANSLRADLDIEPSLGTVRLAQSLIEPAHRPHAIEQPRRNVPMAPTAPSPTADGAMTLAIAPPRPRHPWNLVRHDRAVRTLATKPWPTWTRAIALIVFAVLFDNGHPSASTGERVRGSRIRADELYRAGRAEWNKRTPEALHAALHDFSAIVQRDTMVAQAYSGIADSYAMLAWYGVRPSDKDLAGARLVAIRAAQLRPDLAVTHASLGAIYGLVGDPAGARVELSRAIALNGADAVARDWYAFELAAKGELDEAVGQMLEARSIAPTSATVGTDLATLLFWTRRYASALEELKRVAALEPSYQPMHYLQWRVYAALGMHQSALDALQAVMRDEGRGERSVIDVRQAYSRGDWRAVLERRLEALEQPAPHARRRSVEAAVLAAQLGHPDSAAAWLSRARREGNVAVRFAWLDPALNDLRDDPRLRAVLRRE